MSNFLRYSFFCVVVSSVKSLVSLVIPNYHPNLLSNHKYPNSMLLSLLLSMLFDEAMLYNLDSSRTNFFLANFPIDFFFVNFFLSEDNFTEYLN